MSAESMLSYLISYSVQLALVLGLGLALPTIFGLRRATPLLHYWQLLLGAGLLLPLGWMLRPLPARPSSSISSAKRSAGASVSSSRRTLDPTPWRW